MAYTVVDHFRAGMDVRRDIVTAPAGTARMIKDAHVTPGGEIEKRKAFVLHKDIATIDGGTYAAGQGSETWGLVGLAGKLYVFHGGTDPWWTSDPDIEIVRLNGAAWDPQTGPFDAQFPRNIYDTTIFDNNIFLSIVGGSAGSPAPEFWYVDPGTSAAVVTGTFADGRWLETCRTKIYGARLRTLYMCATGAPTDWTTTSDAGSVDVAIHQAQGGQLNGIGLYYDGLALFTRHSIQTWSVDADPSKNQLLQVINGDGTVAPWAVTPYGNGDLIYLSPSGIRSLASKDSSRAAAVSDLGSPIDPIIQDAWITGTSVPFRRSIGLVEPVSGRLWIILDNKIYVLSLYTGGGVSAWSMYDPGFDIHEAAVADDRVYLRSDDKIYVYGGADNNTYDATEAEVTLPYMSVEAPATNKLWYAVDAACKGNWTIGASFDPDNVAYESLGTFTKTSYPVGRFGMNGRSTHIGVQFKTTDASAAKLMNFAVHYDVEDTA